MDKFIRLYDPYTKILGDKFELVVVPYSEDTDVLRGKNSSRTDVQTEETDADIKADFIKQGYTITSGGSNPLVDPKQFYILNDTGGSVDSTFGTDLVIGDVIHLIDGRDNNDFITTHSFRVIGTADTEAGKWCSDCGVNKIKIEVPEDHDVYKRPAILQEVDSAGTTVNNHATAAYKSTRYDKSEVIRLDTIASFKEDPDNKLRMLVKFKEGIKPKGGYVINDDIVHTGALNDLIVDASSYIGDQVQVKIEIDNTASPETFKWRYGDYITSTAPASAYAETNRGLSLYFVDLDLGDGNIRVKWIATTGHTTDTWTFTVYPNSTKMYRNQAGKLRNLFDVTTFKPKLNSK